MMKERGQEEDDDEGDGTRDGCDMAGGEELCLTEVVLVVRGRRIRVDRARLALVSKFFRALFSHQFEVHFRLWKNPTHFQIQITYL